MTTPCLVDRDDTVVCINTGFGKVFVDPDVLGVVVRTQFFQIL